MLLKNGFSQFGCCEGFKLTEVALVNERSET